MTGRILEPHKKAYLAAALFLSWGVFLTLVLTFGRGVASRMINALEGWVARATHDVTITDVTMNYDLKESFVVGKYYYPVYTAEGEIEGGDAGLLFEALDDTIAYLDGNGAFKGEKRDDVVTTGRVRITSKYDSHFEKIITLTFERTYPSACTANYSVKGDGFQTKCAYVGVPMYVYTNLPKGELYSESDYTILYDPEYFRYEGGHVVVPIKPTPEGETVTLTYRYGNGLSDETDPFSIAESAEVTRISTVRLGKDVLEKCHIYVGASYFVTLYENREKQITDFDVIADKSAGIKWTGAGNLYFSKAGTHTVTVVLPNGFSKSFTVKVANLMSFPEISGLERDEKGVIHMTDVEPLSFHYHFPSSVTYKKMSFVYDKELLGIKYDAEAKTITVKAKKAGDTSFTILVDDGDQHFERTYRVSVEKMSGLLYTIGKHAGKLVQEMVGHGGGFVILGCFTMQMFAFITVRKRLPRMLLYTSCGLFFALLTEFIQFFMPHRDCSIGDVGIDTTGFFLGTLLVWIGVRIACRVRAAREKKQSKTDGEAMEEGA